MTSRILRGLLGITLWTTINYTGASSPRSVSRERIEISHPSAEELVRAVPMDEMMDFYTDCNNRVYEGDTFYPEKTIQEIVEGVAKRKRLEALMTDYFNEEMSQKEGVDNSSGIYDPLAGKGRFEDGFNFPRIRHHRWKEKHLAIDMFAPVGTKVYAPVSGVVVAAANDWKGRWDRRQGFIYESGGLSGLSGNGIIFFDSVTSSYYFAIHMDSVNVTTGDIVERGQLIGTVGRTGNAITPYSGSELHITRKTPGIGCGMSDVLLADNIYSDLVAARKEWLANNNDKN